jgi:hypothetical protein
MRAALTAVAGEHKKKVRVLKAQLKSERERWEKEQSELLQQVARLEKNRDELRSLLKEQREQLTKFTALVTGEDADDDKVEVSPQKKARVDETSPENKSNDNKGAVQNVASMKKSEEKKGQQEQQEESEEWVVIQLGETRQQGRNTAFKQVVRGKRNRAALPEYSDCAQCKAYFDALASELPNVSRKQLVQQCTRHRSLFPEVPTPPGYWDVGF